MPQQSNLPACATIALIAALVALAVGGAEAAAYTSPANDRSTLGRFEIHTDTTADDLYDLLRSRYDERLEVNQSQATTKGS